MHKLKPEGYAKMLVSTEAWSWFSDFINGQITQCKDQALEAGSMEELHHLRGVIEGLRKPINLVNDLVESSTD